MPEIAFYTNPQSRGQIVHWMLEELAEPYETNWIEYGEQMKSAEYLAVNPMGKVPAVVHKGKVITECAAICAYLAASYPEKGLIPPVGDPRLADFYRWLFFAAGPVEQATTVKSMQWEASDEQSRMLGFGSIVSTFDALELALEPGPYVCGEQFTAVDVYVGSALNWGMMFGTIDKRDAFETYVARLVERPALKNMQAINHERVEGAQQ